MLTVLAQGALLGEAVALRWDVLAAAASLLAITVVLRARRDVAESMGFTQGDVALLTIGTVAGQVLNVPLAIVDGAVLALNVGGALVPLVLVVRLARRGTLRVDLALLGALLVALATWAVVEIEPGRGVIAPFPAFLAPPAVGLLFGLAVGRARPSRAGPLAFAAGSIGALAGADLVVLPDIASLARGAPAGTALVVGGAGALDLVFLSGAVGLALSLVLAIAFTRAPDAPTLGPGAPLRVSDPRALLAAAERLPGLTPREVCLVHLARANEMLADGDAARATREAHAAVDALLRAGSSALLERVRRGGATPALAADLAAITWRVRDARAGAPTWHEAADVVEAAKRAAGGLWEHAPGTVRLEVGRA